MRVLSPPQELLELAATLNGGDIETEGANSGDNPASGS